MRWIFEDEAVELQPSLGVPFGAPLDYNPYEQT
jgi:hypothetical protein